MRYSAIKDKLELEGSRLKGPSDMVHLELLVAQRASLPRFGRVKPLRNAGPGFITGMKTSPKDCVFLRFPSICNEI